MNKFLIILLIIILFFLLYRPHYENFDKYFDNNIRENEKKVLWDKDNIYYFRNIPTNIINKYNINNTNDMKYGDIKKYLSQEKPTYISDDTICTYSFINPQWARNINLPIEDPLKSLYINKSDYNVYENKDKLNISELSYYNKTNTDYKFMTPYEKNYKFCNLINNQPSCSIFTCGDKKKHRYILDNLFNRKKTIKENINKKELEKLRSENFDYYTTVNNRLKKLYPN